MRADGRWLPATVLIDLLRNFDTIPHETLLAKMKCKGFSETVVEWFKPYLTDEMFLFQLTIFYSVPHTCMCAYQESVHYQELVPFSTLI